MTRLKRNQIELIAVCLFATIVLYTLFVRSLGMADNGDFGRLMAEIHLSYPSHVADQHKFFGYFLQSYPYEHNKAYWGEEKETYLSTQLVFLKIASVLNKLFISESYFYVPALGMIHAVLLTAAILLLLLAAKTESIPQRIGYACLIILLFSDTAYITFLNSLYSEASLYISYFFLLAASLYCLRQNNPSPISMVLFTLAAFLFMFAKVQNCFAGVLIGLFFATFLFRTRPSWKKGLVVFLSVSLLAGSLLLYISHPKGLNDVTTYDSFFYGILKDSPHPDKDMAFFDIDPSYRALAGTTYYMDKNVDIRSDKFRADVYDRISHMKIVHYYVLHPQRLLQKLDAAAVQANVVREPAIGNYTRASLMPEQSKSELFTAWSRLKPMLLPDRFAGIMVYFILYSILLALIFFTSKERSTKYVMGWFFVLGLIALASFGITVVAEGENDLIKHLFGFHIVWDSTLLIFIYCLIRITVHWTQVLRLKRTAAAGQ
ncbi:hypothetical protein [Paenibacillus turpanensis]|uniref:glycan biosynthesis hexose transferase WsfD n=1 Tax=Paenibacillus turpanensis TaxID=2689078 RepID=UPI00140AC1F6|nr:hypothetical protein [Paenibacillus turpanensis]